MERPSRSNLTRYNSRYGDAVLVYVDVPESPVPRRAGEERSRGQVAPDFAGETDGILAVPV